jgi:tRNA G18 (ribose-2'-O)-methylase SpoU
MRKMFDLTVKIPMATNFDSLNAAAAAAVVMFQVGHYHRSRAK